MIRLFRRLRNIWHRAFPPKPVRLPGKWPWVQPGHLRIGTVLWETTDYKIVADGKGGQISLFKRPPARKLSERYRRPPRASNDWMG